MVRNASGGEGNEVAHGLAVALCVLDLRPSRGPDDVPDVDDEDFSGQVDLGLMQPGQTLHGGRGLGRCKPLHDVRVGAAGAGQAQRDVPLQGFANVRIVEGHQEAGAAAHADNLWPVHLRIFPVLTRSAAPWGRQFARRTLICSFLSVRCSAVFLGALRTWLAVGGPWRE